MSSPRIIAAYADGGCIQANPSPIGGTYAACHVTADGARVWQEAGVIPAVAGSVSNNVAEYIACLRALEALPAGWSGRLYSDSRLTLGRLCGEWWEGEIHHVPAVCYGLAGLPPDAIARGRAALGRLGRFTGVLLQGHPTRADLARGFGARRGFPVSAHNVAMDALCRQAATAYLSRHTALAPGASHQGNGNRPASRNKLTGILATRYHLEPSTRWTPLGKKRGLAGVRLRTAGDPDPGEPAPPSGTAGTAGTADSINAIVLSSDSSTVLVRSAVPAVPAVPQPPAPPLCPRPTEVCPTCGDRAWYWDAPAAGWLCATCVRDE